MSSHAHGHDHGVTVHKHPSDFEGAKIAMWLFLFTEILLFGGLFILYAVYRAKFSVDFHTAGYELSKFLGAVNTLVLLTSSLTVVIGIEALQRGKMRLANWMVGLTIVAGGIFMVNKYFEWSAKFHHGIYPGADEMFLRTSGEQTFFNLYYGMTGLHGVHVLVGMGLLAGTLYFMARKPRVSELMDKNLLEQLPEGSRIVVVDAKGKEVGSVADLDSDVQRVDVRVISQPVKPKVDPRTVSKLENVGLYWHLVDVIWIFLFPLIYLV